MSLLSAVQRLSVWNLFKLLKGGQTWHHQCPWKVPFLPSLRFHYSMFIFSLQATQPLIGYALQHCVVVAYFVPPTCWSSLMHITIKQAGNGNFWIPAFVILFSDITTLELAIFKVVQKGCCIWFFCVFDHNLYNDGIDNCPYLIFHFCHPYMVEDCSEDNFLSVAEVIQM